MLSDVKRGVYLQPLKTVTILAKFIKRFGDFRVKKSSENFFSKKIKKLL